MIKFDRVCICASSGTQPRCVRQKYPAEKLRRPCPIALSGANRQRSFADEVGNVTPTSRMSTPASPCLEDVPCWPHEQPDPPREGNQRSEQGKQYLQSSEQQQRPSASAVDVECVLANAADTEKLHETASQDLPLSLQSERPPLML